ncbi:unnamed protein product [Chondrus crispus]|uniref:Uncharacterized protein n=1 Tax=Chondrus crispus TaxID=2769 RepID=R7Q361_CHOCR|nr:unnamed protein product [Chondrus crispus]CDF32343.1 unnamed protein product [Chondrus crispus]|eukprot:XP_005712008.1 unnamed protein product [Chondrus crispus]
MLFGILVLTVLLVHLLFHLGVLLHIPHVASLRLWGSFDTFRQINCISFLPILMFTRAVRVVFIDVFIDNVGHVIVVGLVEAILRPVDIDGVLLARDRVGVAIDVRNAMWPRERLGCVRVIRVGDDVDVEGGATVERDVCRHALYVGDDFRRVEGCGCDGSDRGVLGRIRVDMRWFLCHEAFGPSRLLNVALLCGIGRRGFLVGDGCLFWHGVRGWETGAVTVAV